MQELTKETGAATPMPAYISHKRVWALKIKSVESCGADTTTDENPIVEVTFEGRHFAPRKFNLRGKPTPEAGWYLVQYQDGYISFSPERTFEEGHTPEHQNFSDRVVAEKIELGTKAIKLAQFIGTGTYNDLPEAEKERLQRQMKIMDEYCQVLDERIAAFTHASNEAAYNKQD